MELGLDLPTVDCMKVKYYVVDVKEMDLAMVLNDVNDFVGYSGGDFVVAGVAGVADVAAGVAVVAVAVVAVVDVVDVVGVAGVAGVACVAVVDAAVVVKTVVVTEIEDYLGELISLSVLNY